VSEPDQPLEGLAPRSPFPPGRQGGVSAGCVHSPGVDHVEIDFPIRLRVGTNDVVVLTDPFPSDLVLVAGQLGIPLRFTIWPPASDSGEGPNAR
jgi:hypothetical protein